MTINEWQKSVDEWIHTYGVRYFDELTNMAILAEETGEVARIMARRYGEQSLKEGATLGDLGDELADLIWVATCIANQTGIDLEAALHANLEKKRSAIGSVIGAILAFRALTTALFSSQSRAIKRQ